MSLPEGTLDQTGIYTIQVAATDGQKALGEARLEFVVFDSDSEKSQATASPESLRRMVLPTGDFGGKLVAPDGLAAHLEDLVSRPAQLSIEVPKKTMLGETFLDALVFLSIFVSVLGSEWYLRKKWGLV